MANEQDAGQRQQGEQRQGQQGRQTQGDTSNRGFAAMDDDKQREIASQGGQSVPDEKRSFSQDRELASEAGRKGGEARQGQADAADTAGRDQGSGQGNERSDTRQAGTERDEVDTEDGAGDPENASDAGLEEGQTNTGGGQR